MCPPSDLHPIFERVIPRNEKEAKFNQRARVIWLYGLSGSGKSTLAVALERTLFTQGRATQLLDGDNVRTGLNRNLGFSDEDRVENLRRVAEVAKLFVQAGVITLCSFITPRRAHRAAARAIIGEDDFLEVYVQASFATCAARDPKGLYAKANAGNLQNFTGKDSGFEEPAPEDRSFILNTEAESPETSLERLLGWATPHLRFS